MEIEKRINDKHEEAYLATADQFSITMDKGIKANKIRFVMQGLQNGATKPTIADWLNQLADTITISIGNKNVWKFDPVEYYEYLVRKDKKHGFAFIGDGTGADNHIGIMVFDLPLCPHDKNMIDYMNKEYGFDGSHKVNVLIEYPADANKVDGRKIDVYAISLPESTPNKVIEWEQITKTFTAIGENQIINISQNALKKIYEIMFKQTSYLSEGLTSDLRTIQRLSYQELQEDVLFFDKRIEHFSPMRESESETTGNQSHDDQYPIIPFYHDNDAETSRQLAETSQLAVEVGVAEAISWTQIRIAPLSIYQT